jgi:hypothetical protein
MPRTQGHNPAQARDGLNFLPAFRNIRIDKDKDEMV